MTSDEVVEAMDSIERYKIKLRADFKAARDFYSVQEELITENLRYIKNHCPHDFGEWGMCIFCGAYRHLRV